jgi:hypothetical protein
VTFLFKRDHHVRIATILQALNSELLRDHQCYFGGGTAIVLSRDEYRESVDIDFLISNPLGYRQLRESLTSQNGFASIVRPDSNVTLAREIRADQYGLRTMLQVGNVEIKFEIVLEGRIQLDAPSKADRICGVTTLSAIDMAASKILANSDRWADDSVFSRDLIDLAMLNLPSHKFKKAMAKATQAYGASAQRDLDKAINKLKERQGRLGACLRALKFDTIPEAVVWNQIRSLRSKKMS